MAYWRLFYHIVWGTKERQPCIEDRFASILHEQLRSNAARLGAAVHALGGVEDHVHLAVSVPPSIALSEFIRQLKGSSSHFVTHECSPASPFAWQPAYGVISLDSKQLSGVVQYVIQQRKHHLERTTIAVLERQGQQAGVNDRKLSQNTRQ